MGICCTNTTSPTEQKKDSQTCTKLAREQSQQTIPITSTELVNGNSEISFPQAMKQRSLSQRYSVIEIDEKENNSKFPQFYLLQLFVF